MAKARKPIALWAVPRSISTAFERVFVERGDFKVFHEPFSASYYYSEERQSNRYADQEPKSGCAYAEVLAQILSPSERPVFIKDMAYHVAGFMSREFVASFRNTFIVREPRYVLRSLYEKWPDFTFEETGYEELYHLYQHALEEGQEPVVVDASDLSEDPEKVTAAYCERLGIPHKPEALSWEPREIPEWQMWEGWHENAQKSTGIGTVPHREVRLPKELEEVYDRCLPYYRALCERRLRI
jgi:hypothetical protein